LAKTSVDLGVFDLCALQDLADEPGWGQPWPGSPGLILLFDFFVPSEPGQFRIVFDLGQKWVGWPCINSGVKLPLVLPFWHCIEQLLGRAGDERPLRLCRIASSREGAPPPDRRRREHGLGGARPDHRRRARARARGSSAPVCRRCEHGLGGARPRPSCAGASMSAGELHPRAPPLPCVGASAWELRPQPPLPRARARWSLLHPGPAAASAGATLGDLAQRRLLLLARPPGIRGVTGHDDEAAHSGTVVGEREGRYRYPLPRLARARAKVGSRKTKSRSVGRERGERRFFASWEPSPGTAKGNQTRESGSGGLGRPDLVHIKHALYDSFVVFWSSMILAKTSIDFMTHL
jgi:hypothetical protein